MKLTENLFIAAVTITLAGCNGSGSNFGSDNDVYHFATNWCFHE